VSPDCRVTTKRPFASAVMDGLPWLFVAVVLTMKSCPIRWMGMAVSYGLIGVGWTG
jgi:hypothetical protein